MMPVLILLAITGGCHAVNGDRITARDLAAVSPAFADLAPDTVVGYAPEPGARRTMEPAELLRIAAAGGLELHDRASSVCFERSTAPLEAPRILDALRTSLDRPDAEIEVVEFSRFPVPPGKLVFPLASLPSYSSANVALWNGYVDFEGRHFPIWARARITVTQKRVVAVLPIRAGQTIAAGEVRLEDTRAFPAKSTLLSSPADCVGQMARRFIDTGAPVAASDLVEPNDVERGDMVSVEVQSGAATLLLPAQADLSGRRGQIIPFRNAASGKTFRARIVGKDRALLDCHSPETNK
jgi:flagella basal body P-ring formation protein FlgA